MSDRKRTLRRILLLIPALALLGTPLIAPAPATVAPFSTGIFGYSGNPAHNGGLICSACHSGGAMPTVTLSGPALVESGKTYPFTLTVSGGQQVAGGLDVSVDAGALAVTDPGTQLFFGEITHTSPRLVDGNGDVVFGFDWTAPAAPGTANMYGAGNSVNLNFLNSGDLPDSDQLLIQVEDCVVSFVESGAGTPGTGGFVPSLTGTDGPCTGGYAIHIQNGLGGALAFLWTSDAQATLPFACGNILIDLSSPFFFSFLFQLGGAPGVGGAGSLTLTGPDVTALSGLTLELQALVLDPVACKGVALSPRLSLIVGGC